MQSIFKVLNRMGEISKNLASMSPVYRKKQETVIENSEKQILVNQENLFKNLITEKYTSQKVNQLSNNATPNLLKKALIDQTILESSAKYQLPKSLIQSIIEVESNFNTQAVSSKGAMGLMQLMPDTGKQYNITEPFSIKENIDTGSKHFKKLMDDYNGNLVKALAAYNAGKNSIKNDQVPNYKETQEYIKKVINNFMKHNGVNL